MRKKIIAAIAALAVVAGCAGTASAATQAMVSKANQQIVRQCQVYTGCNSISYTGYAGSNYYYYGGAWHETAHFRYRFYTLYFGACDYDVAVTDGLTGYTHYVGGACRSEFTF